MEKRIGKKIPGSDGSPKSLEGNVKKRWAAPEHNPPAGRTLEEVLWYIGLLTPDTNSG